MAKQVKLASFSRKQQSGSDKRKSGGQLGLYDLPEGWEWSKLGNVAEVLYGKGLPKKDRKAEGTYGVYGSNGLIDRSDRYLVDHPTIIVGRKGSIGAVTLVAKKCWPIDTTFYLKLKSEEMTDLKYLYLALKRANLTSFAITTTIPGINRNDLENVRIRLPPLEVQKRIVKKCDELLSRIKDVTRLREISREETEKIMQSALHEVYSNPEEKGWDLKRLKDFCMINPSRSEVRDLPDDLTVTFVPMKAVSEITGRIEDPETRVLGEVRTGYTYFREEDVLFAKITPSMENGKSAIARNLMNGLGFGSTEFHVIRTLDDTMPEWIYHFVRQKSFRDVAERNMTGSVGQQRVPKKFIENTKIPLPFPEKQKEIVAYLNRVRRQIETLGEKQKETETVLERITPAVLDKAFKGEI